MIPFGRRQALSNLRTAVAAGRCAAVLGPQGSGRTSVLRAVVAGLVADGVDVDLLEGSDAEAGVPLAAFAPLVAAVGLRGADPLEVYTRLPGLVTARRRIVAVDDADRLDRASVVLLGQLSRARARVVVTASGLADLPGTARDADPAGWHIEALGPLGADDLLSLATDILGDELAAPSAAVLVTHALGNPGRAAEMLRAAAGSAVRTDAGIELGPVRVSPRLRQLVAPELPEPGTGPRRLLDLLAVASALPVEVVDPTALEPAASDGLVEVAGAAVRLADPLLDDVLRAAMSPQRQARYCGEAADLVRDRDGWEVDAVLLAARAGRRIDPAVALAAAERALNAHAPDRALQLVRFADPGLADTQLVLGAAHSEQGDHQGAAEALRAALALAGDDRARMRVGQQVGLLHAVRRADPATAVEEVTRIAASVTDPSWRPVLAADLVKWRLMAGLPVDNIEVRPVASQAAVRVNEAVIAAMISTTAGPLDETERHVASGLEALAATDVAPPFAGDLLRLSAYLSLAFGGNLAGAEEFALGYRDAAARSADPALGMWEYGTAELALHAGRTAHADAMSARAMRHLAWRDFTGLRPAARALRAAVLARRGRISLAQELAGQCTPEERADPKVALHLARVEAERQLRHRDRRAAYETLRLAGEAAVAAHNVHLGLLVLDEACMVQPTEEVAALLGAYAKVSDLFALLARRAQALVERRFDLVAECAEGLLALGMPGRAAQAAASAAELAAGTGAGERARRLRRRAVAIVSTAGCARWPAPDEVDPLTGRELEIAELAARRVRSREIAESLGLSVRTVDNHLARVFRKLGVRGRDELPDALSLAPTKPW
ncbi:LuxR C-terminal-related transcriptional regulator [Micromonospora haikouensis]|uniref:helix-turn-helix transcriptional regulator n=1 Tax=Micromonospora haikouensis TaxID=686309 RepID=UPI00341F57B7